MLVCLSYSFTLVSIGMLFNINTHFIITHVCMFKRRMYIEVLDVDELLVEMSV